MTFRYRVRRALPAVATVLVVMPAIYACSTTGKLSVGAAGVPSTQPAAAVAAAVQSGSARLTPLAGVFGSGAKPLRGVPKEDARRGLVYRGLTAATTGPCVGGYQIDGTTQPTCTHGPDEPRLDVSVKLDAKPLAAAAATTTGLPVCEGDGVTGRRVEVLYVHGATSRYAQYLDTFRTDAEAVDDIYNKSAQETGGERHVRFVTEIVGGLCRAVVRDVQVADSALSDFSATRTAVIALGYQRTDRHYLMFVDSNVYCGIGELAGDTRKSDANASNSGPFYARVDNGCWTDRVAPAHELGHTLGAVSDDAPNSSHHGHCTDEYDVMCYKDDPSTVLHTACPDTAHDLRLDCNHDDYYNTDPSPGSYLASEFNVADNLFLIKGAGTGTSASPSPSASPTPSTTAGPATTVRLVGKPSARCADMNNDTITNGTQAQLWDCSGARNQAWTVTSGRALVLHDNKCLDAYLQGTSNGTAVVIWDCNGQTNQQWSFNADGTVTGVQSGLCLDASAGGTANGTKLILWTCNGQSNQQWSRS